MACGLFSLYKLKQTMNKIYNILLVTLVTSLSYSQSYNYKQEKEFIISGIISSLDNEELLEYATITLLDTDDNSVITGGVSDNLGKFSINIFVIGVLSLMMNKASKSSNSIEASFPSTKGWLKTLKLNLSL